MEAQRQQQQQAQLQQQQLMQQQQQQLLAQVSYEARAFWSNRTGMILLNRSMRAYVGRSHESQLAWLVHPSMPPGTFAFVSEVCIGSWADTGLLSRETLCNSQSSYYWPVRGEAGRDVCRLPTMQLSQKVQGVQNSSGCGVH